MIAEHFAATHRNHAQARDFDHSLGARQPIERVLVGAAHVKLRDHGVAARHQVFETVVEIREGIEQ